MEAAMISQGICYVVIGTSYFAVGFIMIGAAERLVGKRMAERLARMSHAMHILLGLGCIVLGLTYFRG